MTMMTILMIVIAVAVMTISTFLYNKFMSKAAYEKKSAQKQEKFLEMVEKVSSTFNNAYTEYTSKNEELDKLNKTRKLWFDSSEDDPMAKENLRDIDAKIVIIEGRIKYKTSVLNFVVREIMDEEGVIEHIRATNFDLYRKAVLWNNNHKAEIEEIRNKKK